ncbi:matrix metalloproteinase-C-like [Tubulanus polymorphus]|uniref:matrix metalloproteinase-C-like n=1 Tax=Tubulanus polymorphus TaxID=672921 RepID=UPI003DA2F9F8
MIPEPGQPIQAAVYDKRTESALVFGGRKLWRYRYNSNEHRFHLDNGYPKDYSHRQDFPHNPEAAFLDFVGWTVILEDGYFWEFSEDQDKNKKYKLADYFPNAPQGEIDSATMHGNTIFMFQGQYYYTRTGNDPMVGPISKDKRWMGC